MNLEQLTALIIAVGGVVTALSTWIKSKGDKRQSSINEWKELTSSYKKDYQDLKNKFEDLENKVNERDHQHQLEHDKWKKERENILQENFDLNKRITVLEETLIQEGIDVDDL